MGNAVLRSVVWLTALVVPVVRIVAAADGSSTGGVTMGQVNVPADDAVRAPYDPRDKSEMDDLASADDIAVFTAGLSADWTLFVEDRLHSIRSANGLPVRWLKNLPAHTGSFADTARPGEFYVFQAGVYAARSPIGPLDVRFIDLPGIRCFNTGGIDFVGRSFSAPVHVAKGQLQALWFGIDVPKSGVAAVKGRIIITDRATGVSQTIEVALTVAGAVLDDHGDRDSWRLSRLRWLDSTIGLNEDMVTQPFVPIVRRSGTLKVLGRELVLGSNGLPGQIRSFYNAGNTAILNQPTRELLSAPFRFVVETGAGPVVFAPGKLSFERELNGTIGWRAESEASGIRMAVEGVMEYDGFIECRCRISSAEPVMVKDVRLEVDVAAGADEYFMGLGKAGGRSPAAVDWKWNTRVNQDGFWIGAVNGGFKLELYGANRRTPLINAYYHFREIVVPESWGGIDGKTGGIRLAKAADGGTRAVAYSGARRIDPAIPLDFNFKLFLTPFKPLDT
ncbi:MAG: glycoside hydrolase domain-containing protein, partial [bacterium]